MEWGNALPSNNTIQILYDGVSAIWTKDAVVCTYIIIIITIMSEHTNFIGLLQLQQESDIGAVN